MNVFERVKETIKKKNKKKGSISFPVLLGAGAMFLGGLFFMADMPLKLILSNEMADTVNNAAASAVTQIVEDEVKYGRLIIDADRAEQAAYDVFARTYALNKTRNGTHLEARPESKLAKDPEITVLVESKPARANDNWKGIITLPNGRELTVEESTVVVYAKLTFDPLIRKNDSGMVLERFAASEVSFPDYAVREE